MWEWLAECKMCGEDTVYVLRLNSNIVAERCEEGCYSCTHHNTGKPIIEQDLSFPAKTRAKLEAEVAVW